jgi:hypothetical protein
MIVDTSVISSSPRKKAAVKKQQASIKLKTTEYNNRYFRMQAQAVVQTNKH